MSGRECTAELRQKLEKYQKKMEKLAEGQGKAALQMQLDEVSDEIVKGVPVEKFFGLHSRLKAIKAERKALCSEQTPPQTIFKTPVQLLFNIGKRITNIDEMEESRAESFDVHDLKKELVKFGLVDFFPDIQKHAEVVYAHVNAVKKEKVLRTCDLIDAVEYCQMLCLSEKFPHYKKFLHNQGGCGRVPGLKCDDCDEKKKAIAQSDGPNAEGSKFSGSESNTQAALNPITSSKISDFNATLEKRNSFLDHINSQLLLQVSMEKDKVKDLKCQLDALKSTTSNQTSLQTINSLKDQLAMLNVEKRNIEKENSRMRDLITLNRTSASAIVERTMNYQDGIVDVQEAASSAE